MLPEEPARRILDANMNRAAEAARVVEDLARFRLNSLPLAAEARSIRHSIRGLPKFLRIEPAALLQARDADGDVSRELTRGPRTDGLAGANFSRLQEAIRAIEEVATEGTDMISNIRYRAYSLEKRMGRLLTCRAPEVLAGPAVCVIVTREMIDYPLAFIGEAVAGGAIMIQIREKSLQSAELVRYACEAREITSRAGALLVINDRPDIAVAARAEGVHGGQEDFSAADMRRIVGDDAVVGVSTHNGNEVDEACRSGADYIGFGPVFATNTKQRAPVLPGSLDNAIKRSSVPVYAIGGIGPDNIEEVAALGVRCVAVCASVATAADPRLAVQTMIDTLEKT